MNSENVRDLLYDYVRGKLTPVQKKIVEDQLSTSTEIRNELKRVKGYYDSIDSLEPVPVPDNFISDIHKRIDSTGNKNFIQKIFFPLHVKLPMELVGVVGTVLLVVYFFIPQLEDKKVAENFVAEQGIDSDLKDNSKPVELSDATPLPELQKQIAPSEPDEIITSKDKQLSGVESSADVKGSEYKERKKVDKSLLPEPQKQSAPSEPDKISASKDKQIAGVESQANVKGFESKKQKKVDNSPDDNFFEKPKTVESSKGFAKEEKSLPPTASTPPLSKRSLTSNEIIYNNFDEIRASQPPAPEEQLASVLEMDHQNLQTKGSVSEKQIALSIDWSPELIEKQRSDHSKSKGKQQDVTSKSESHIVIENEILADDNEFAVEEKKSRADYLIGIIENYGLNWFLADSSELYKMLSVAVPVKLMDTFLNELEKRGDVKVNGKIPKGNDQEVDTIVVLLKLIEK